MVCFGCVSFSQDSFRNSLKVSNSLDLNHVEKIVWSDLDQNSLQRLSADDRIQQGFHMSMKVLCIGSHYILNL